MPLSVGDSAPNFKLLDQNEKEHALADYRGQYVLLYFYPKDDTPGCTTEACGLRDLFPSFEKINVKVFGISADSTTSHKKFAAKFKLPFTLLADTSKAVIKYYGVWGPKKLMGRQYDGIIRTSFLINPEGKIYKIYAAVKPDLHAQEVLEDLAAISK